ncbi:MAG: hypothetical protein ACJ8F7_18910 [Gemmataceae bacterium]
MPSWMFINAQDRPAARRRQEVLAKIDSWWEAFRGKAAALDELFRGQSNWEVAPWMTRHLGDIDARLTWEFGPDHVTGGHQLVVTPESHKQLRPLVATLIDRAPALPDWSFSPYRLPESLDMARQLVEAKTGEPLPERLTVRANAGELNRIDVVVESPGFPRSDKQQALHQAFVLVELLLGEEVLDKWVGTIEVERSRPGKHSLPPERLKPTVDALVVAALDQLPSQPLWAEPSPDQGSVLKLEPGKQDDYPAKDDLLVASTVYPQILVASLNDPTFYSERFSRHDERFAYLKIDGREGAGTFADRSAMEDALEDALRPAGVGWVIGGGTGLRYSYIDLALTNVGQAADLARRVLQGGNVSRRSWLLFSDSEWHDEWVGVWDDSAAPPTD